MCVCVCVYVCVCVCVCVYVVCMRMCTVRVCACIRTYTQIHNLIFTHVLVRRYTSYDGHVARLSVASSRDLLSWTKHG